MAGRETVAFRLFLPPSDHLPPVLGDGARVVLQHPAQHADQGAVQEFAAASADPAFGYRIHARGPHVAEHGPDPCASEDRVDAAV